MYEIRLTHTKTWKQGLISNVCIPLPPSHITRNTTHRFLRLVILVRKRIMNENPTHLMFRTYRGSQIIWTPNENQLPLNTCKKLRNERTIYVCCTVELGCTEIKFTISEVIHLMLKKKFTLHVRSCKCAFKLRSFGHKNERKRFNLVLLGSGFA